MTRWKLWEGGCGCMVQLKQIRGWLDTQPAPRWLGEPVREWWGSTPVWQPWKWRDGQDIAKWESRDFITGVRYGLRNSKVSQKQAFELLSQPVSYSTKTFQNQQRARRTDTNSDRVCGRRASVTVASKILLCEQNLGQWPASFIACSKFKHRIFICKWNIIDIITFWKIKITNDDQNTYQC